MSFRIDERAAAPGAATSAAKDGRGHILDPVG